MAPRYGYALKGERSQGQVPCNRGRNTFILATLGPQGLVGTMTVEGATNTAVLLTHLDRVLCPALRPGQIVVLDNLAAHKNEAVREKIEAGGCRLLFLPAYSPDFNPIEHAFRVEPSAAVIFRGRAAPTEQTFSKVHRIIFLHGEARSM